MILLIMHVVYLKWTSQRKHALIDTDNKWENHNQLEHGYKFWDQFYFRDKQAYKYEEPYKEPYTILQMWTNGLVKLQIRVVM